MTARPNSGHWLAVPRAARDRRSRSLASLERLGFIRLTLSDCRGPPPVLAKAGEAAAVEAVVLVRGGVEARAHNEDHQAISCTTRTSQKSRSGRQPAINRSGHIATCASLPPELRCLPVPKAVTGGLILERLQSAGNGQSDVHFGQSCLIPGKTISGFRYAFSSIKLPDGSAIMSFICSSGCPW